MTPWGASTTNFFRTSAGSVVLRRTYKKIGGELSGTVAHEGIRVPLDVHLDEI